MPRWPRTATPPPGLVYRSEFLTADEETALVREVEAISFREVRMHGVAARRTTAHYGYSYAYETFRVEPTEPIPPFLQPLRRRCADFASLAWEELVEALVTRYPPGAGIGWHRDAPAFGDKVIGVSLHAPCIMRFRWEKGAERLVYERVLEPRSIYVIGGTARWQWQHSITNTPGLRYSVTFRTLRRRL